jgi:hypothetical protein
VGRRRDDRPIIGVEWLDARKNISLFGADTVVSQPDFIAYLVEPMKLVRHGRVVYIFSWSDVFFWIQDS